MPESIIYDIQAPGLERMIEMMGLATSGAAKMEESIKALSDAARAFSSAQKGAATEQAKGQTAAEKAAAAAEKAAQKAAAAAEKRAAAEHAAAEKRAAAAEKAAAKAAAAAEKQEAAQRAAAEAMEAAATRAELTASRMATEGTRAYETLLNVGGQYGQMIRDGVRETSELAKTWRAGLSPAERTALNLAKMSAATDDATAQTLAFSLATSEATAKLTDQIRRQDENVGVNNKLSRSLSRIIQEQTDAISLAVVYTDQVGDQTAALRESAKGIDETVKKLDSLEMAMSALGVPGAGLVGTAKSVNESLKGMAETGSPAQASLLKVGIAVGSVAAAGTAAVAGVAAIGAAIVAVTAQAADWNAELKQVGLSIGQAPLERYSASVGTVGNVVKALGVQLAATFGPAIEAAATRIAALGLAGIDAFKNLRKGEDVMQRLARFAAEVLTEALFAPVTAIAKLGKAFGALAEMAGFEEMAAGAKEFDSVVQSWKTDQADAVTAALKMLGRDAMAPLVAVTEDYMRAAEKLVTKQTAINAAARDGAAATKEQVAATAELQAVARESVMLLGESAPLAFRQAQQGIAQVSDEMIKRSIEASNVAAANMAAAAERGRQSWSGSFSSIGDSAGKLSAMMISYSQKQGDAAHKAAVIAFRVQQGAGLVSVAISTSQAIMQALASMPPPASYVAAGAALLAGIAQGATILAQSPPSPSGATSASMPTAPTAPSMNTPKPTTALKAEQSVAISGTESEIDTGGFSAAAQVQVTDAYIAPSSSSMQIRTTPGDAVSIERGGAKADRDAAMLTLLQTLIDETRGQGRAMMDMIGELRLSRHRRETAIGGAY